MNRIWSYVKKVEKALPPQDRILIAGELYSRLKARRIAMEKDLGRKASEAEIDAMLATEGTPEAVASRFAAGAGEGMDPLVGRYLSAVRRRLPEAEAFDILAELREAIDASIDAKSDQLGGKAGPDDVAAVLKDFGHPTLVAARYQTQQYLIGPKLYPWFWPAQRTALGVTLAFLVVTTVIDAVDARAPFSAFISDVFGWWDMLLVVFGMVTAVFVIVERTEAPVKLAQGWDPKRLPHDDIRPPKPLFESLFALLFDVIFILWWAGIITTPWRKDASVAFDFTSVWDNLHTPILALALVTAAVHAADIVYPAWSRLRSAVSIAGHVGGLAVMAALLSADRLITVTEMPNGDTNAAQLAWWLDGPFRLVLFMLAVGWAIGLGVEVWRQFRATRPVRPMAPPPAGAPA